MYIRPYCGCPNIDDVLAVSGNIVTKLLSRNTRKKKKVSFKESRKQIADRDPGTFFLKLRPRNLILVHTGNSCVFASIIACSSSLRYSLLHSRAAPPASAAHLHSGRHGGRLKRDRGVHDRRGSVAARLRPVSGAPAPVPGHRLCRRGHGGHAAVLRGGP